MQILIFCIFLFFKHNILTVFKYVLFNVIELALIQALRFITRILLFKGCILEFDVWPGYWSISNDSGLFLPRTTLHGGGHKTSFYWTGKKNSGPFYFLSLSLAGLPG